MPLLVLGVSWAVFGLAGCGGNSSQSDGGMVKPDPNATKTTNEMAEFYKKNPLNVNPKK